jgi:vacuole morphology and inheritance protein 14
LEGANTGYAAGGGRSASAASPLNPKSRAGASGSGSGSGSGLMSAGVSIGGAVASMNSSAGLGTIRSGSPPPGGARRKLLGGIRRGVGPG